MILGCAHTDGLYTYPNESGTQLSDGASVIKDLGLTGIKLYVTPEYATKNYPLHTFDGDAPTSMEELVSRGDFDSVLTMGWEQVVLTCYSFANGTTNWWMVDCGAAKIEAEEQEFFNLADYLLKSFSAITFDLQGWEQTWGYRNGAGVLDSNVPRHYKNQYLAFLAARHRGIARARAANPTSTCIVRCVLEENRIWDFNERPHRRTVTGDISPIYQPDVVSWSAYEYFIQGLASWAGTDFANWQAQSEILLRRGFATLRRMYPGLPIKLGEYGLPEHDAPVGFSSIIGDMVEHIVAVAAQEGAESAYYWEVFDNEEDLLLPEGHKGYDLVEPDGSLSQAGIALQALAGS
jgi:hypothetical protein